MIKTTEIQPSPKPGIDPQLHHRWEVSADGIISVLGAATFTTIGYLVRKSLEAWNQQTLRNQEILHLKEIIKEAVNKLDSLKTQVSDLQAMTAKNNAEHSGILDRLRFLEDRINHLEQTTP